MTVTTGVFYKRIHLLGLPRIPSSGPALLIANHPGSLMDAALLGLLLKRRLHFFARGDIFKHPLVSRLLRSLHMHPVHHHLDGRQSLGANDQSFDLAVSLLQAGELVLFFPEGFSHIDYSLLPFKKGSFRLALQAMEKAGLPSLPIIPIGIHYSHPTAPFSTVWITIGQAIETSVYFPLYQTHPAQAIKQLSNHAFTAIQPLMIGVSQQDAPALFDLLQLIRQESNYSQLSGQQQWDYEKKISRLLPDSEDLIESIRKYSMLMRANDAKEEVVARPTTETRPAWLIGLLTFPGKLLNYAPLGVAKWFADNKVTRVDFYAWILVASAGILSFIWQVLLFITIWATISFMAAVAGLIACWISGWIWWKLEPFYQQAKHQQQAKKIPGPKLSLIRANRLAIIDLLKASLS